jgi:pimeloyl-ACP methyl ester carboxylesterase
MRTHLARFALPLVILALPALTGADGDGCDSPSPSADAGGGSDESDATPGDESDAGGACTPDCTARCGEANDGCGGTCGACTVATFTDEVWTWDQAVDACSYSNNGNPFWDWTMQGREPALPGRYPVFLFLVGTGDVETNPFALSIVDSMAARGYVAASVPYASLDGIGAVLNDATAACGIGAKKAGCIFGAGEGSAITRLCARANADCSRGIVIAGHSQGAMLATLARDHDPRVRAVYGIGLGIHEHISIPALGLDLDADLSGCAPPAKRALPADRLRVVDGESEYVYGTSLQQDMRDLTDMNCDAGSLECLRPDGSGWVVFPDAASQTDHDESDGREGVPAADLSLVGGGA